MFFTEKLAVVQFTKISLYFLINNMTQMIIQEVKNRIFLTFLLYMQHIILLMMDHKFTYIHLKG